MAEGVGLHEPSELLRQETIELHRAIKSLIEELEAVDWYAQRIDATTDPELRAVLIHNRDEEKEHACMTLEWIRRRDPHFDEQLRRYLFRSGSIVEAEEQAEQAGGGGGNGAAASDPSLAIGDLAREAAR